MQHAVSFYNKQHLLVGASFPSSLASVYLEKVCKGAVKEDVIMGKDESTVETPLWIRNIQLAIFSIIIAIIQSIGSAHHSKQIFFHGFHLLVWLQVVMLSFDGVLGATVMKYLEWFGNGT
jgi:hypothetical protein